MYQNDGTVYDANGVHWKRLAIFGPNKIAKYDETKSGTFRSALGDASNPNPLSIYSLQSATDTYRVIMGCIKSERPDKQYVQIAVINMVTGEVVLQPTTMDAWTTDYAEGSIILYGQFGKTTVLDKVVGV